MPNATDLVQQTLSLLQTPSTPGAEVHLIERKEETWRIESNGRGRGNVNIAHANSAHCQMSIRLYLPDGRFGHATLTAADQEELAAHVPNLVQRAHSDTANHARSAQAGPPERYDIPRSGLSICDPRHGRLTAEDREDILRWHWGAVSEAHSRLHPQHFALYECQQTRTYGSSRGAFVSEPSTRYQVNGAAHLNLRNARRRTAGTVNSRHFADIASHPLGTEMANRLKAGEHNAKFPKTTLPVVFESQLIAQILALIPPAFDATRIAAGESCLKDLFGTKLSRCGVHIVDDAQETCGLHTRGFDERGIPSIPLPLLQDGIPTHMYRTTEQARQRNTRPTGHSRLDGSLWPGNLFLRPGNRTKNMMLVDVGRHLLATDLVVPPTLDVASGNMTLTVWLLLSHPDHPVGRIGVRQIETTLPAFLASITQVASDPCRHGSVVACTVVTEGLPLSEV